MEPEISLSCKDLVKTYPGVIAMDHINFELRKGEVHALLGENGAGKSTLIKSIAGAHQCDSGIRLYQMLQRVKIVAADIHILTIYILRLAVMFQIGH